MRLRVESKGNSFTRGQLRSSEGLSFPCIAAAVTSAFSVGSPDALNLPGFPSSTALLHKAASASMLRPRSPLGETGPSISARRVTVIRFCVSVPVLSEQITVALPSVSTAGRRRMIALLLAMRCTPMDKTIVTIAGSPSGIAATARLTESMKLSSRGTC